jgi:outer membrane cobalamin receptor
MRLRRSLPLAGCLLALAASPLMAEPLTGTVVGPDDRPVARASVVLARPAGGVLQAHTDEEGRFAVDVAPGRYVVHVAAADALASEAHTVDVAAGVTTEVSIRLHLAALAETVVVSGAHVPMASSRTGASLTVIDEHELETRQVDGAADALRSVPGLGIARSGTRGSVTSIFPRGGESDFTLVTIDGIRLNDLGGDFDAAHLTTFDLQQVEVVRGPQSSTHGSDAIGGVVSLVTRRGGPPRAAGLFEGGSFGTVRSNLTTAGSAGSLRWGGGVERLASDGFTGTAPATGERVTNDDYRRTDATLSLGYDTRRWQATALVRGGTNARGVPGPFGSDPGGTFGGVDRISRGDNDTLAVGASASYLAADGLQVRAQGTFADRDSRFISAFAPDEPTMSANRLVTGRVQVDGAVTPAVSWTAGAELARERAGSSFITRTGGALVDVSRSLLGSFVEGRVTHSRLAVQAGLRAERISRDALPGDASAFQPRPDFTRDVVVSANPRASVSLRLHETSSGWTRLRANAGTGIRAPGAFEIAYTDNPNLRPERSRSVDVGVEQGWAGGRLVTDVAYFRNRYDDLIVTVGRALADASRYVSDNISNARAHGLEASVAARPLRAVSLRAGYAWLGTEILAVDGAGVAPAPFEVGDPLLRRPRQSGFLDAVITTNRVSGYFRVDGRGHWLDIDPSFGASGGLYDARGFVVADAGVSVAVRRLVDARLRVTNLFDRQYEEILGFPALGRAVVVGVRVASGR